MEIKHVCEDNPADVEPITMLKTKPVIQCVQKSLAATKITCRWVVTASNGQVKARLTTRDDEQELHGHEGFYSGTPTITYPKALLVLAAKLSHVVAFGDYSGAFYQALLEEEVNVETPGRA